MKTISSISTLLLAAAMFSGCVGDHSAQNGGDTSQNGYKITLTTDSFKLYTGFAKSAENSANGGVYLVKKQSAAKSDTTATAVQ